MLPKRVLSISCIVPSWHCDVASSRRTPAGVVKTGMPNKNRQTVVKRGDVGSSGLRASPIVPIYWSTHAFCHGKRRESKGGAGKAGPMGQYQGLPNWRFHLNRGIPFGEFESVIAKVRHAFTALPGGRGLLSLCNRLLNRRPPVVYFHHKNSLHLAISNCQTILRESTSCPTRCRELVAGWPDFIGVVDASSHGVGGRGCIDKKK